MLVSKIQPKLIPKVQFSPGGKSWLDTGYPPAYNKLIVWLRGENTSDTAKKDFINSYDFLIQNCPPDYWTNELGETMTNELGEPMYSELLYAGWGCEYLAPAVGELGHTELTAADTLGVLYTLGVPNVLTTSTMGAWVNNQGFHNSASGKGTLFYNQVLTGGELAAVQAWIA